MSTPLHIAELNRAREYYNPLRGLTIERVVTLIDESERGRYDEIQKLNRVSEKRHPALLALKSRRLSALKKLDWDTKIRSELPRGITEAQAKRQRDALRGAYEQIENLPQAIAFTALASFRGFSHLEKRHRDDNPNLPVVRLNPVPQYHWLRDSQTWAWRYDATALGNESSSTPIDPADFIIREVDDPLCEIALLCMVRRSLAKRNWTVFQEDYALASIFAMLGENTPLDKVKEYLEIVKKVTNSSRGALPPGCTIEALDLGNLDGVQFKNFIAAEDEDLVLAGTGGLLSMLTADTGLGGDGQSSNHDKAFDGIAIAEAREVTALFQQQFDAAFLTREFPGEPHVAYFELAAVDEEDQDKLAERVVKYHSAGLEADAEEISEKSALKLTRKALPAPVALPGDELPAAPEKTAKETALTNRAAAIEAGNMERFLAAAGARLAAADQAALAPVLDRVAALYAVMDDDAAFAAGYAQLMADLPALEKQALSAEASAEVETVLSEIIGTATLSGYATAAEARKKALADKSILTAPGAKSGGSPKNSRETALNRP